MRVLLIDGDIFCRRAAHGAAAANATASAEEKDACKRLDAALERLQANLRGDRMLAAIGLGESFRKAIAPSYKAERRRRLAPASLPAVRARLAERIEARSSPGLEADDLLGIWATAPDLSFAASSPTSQSRSPTGPRIIVSNDKDLLSIPGLHGSESGRVWRVGADEAELRHLAQTLIGDASDGYRGCPGVGPKRAAALLSAAGRDPWSAVLSAYRRSGLGLESALVQARLARILRHGEVDPATRRPILWTPARLRFCGGAQLARRAVAPFLPQRSQIRGFPP